MRTSRLLPPALVLAAVMLSACGSDDSTLTAAPAAPAPSAASPSASAVPEEAAIAVTATPDAMAGVNLHVVASGFRWAPEHASSKAVDGEGHAHVYVDGTKVGRLYGEWMHLDLPTGQHEIRVSLNSNDHEELQPEVEQTVVVDVPEPRKPMS